MMRIWAIVIVILAVVAGLLLFYDGKENSRMIDPASLPRVDVAQAWKDVEMIAAIVPRHSGTDSHRAAIDVIAATARERGAKVTVDTWQEYTAFGDAFFGNIIAEVPGLDTSRFMIVGSHFDTKQGIKGFVGANDGASSTGALLAMIGALRDVPPPVTLRFVFFDGEECYHNYNWIDGLHGSRRYASQLADSGEFTKCRAMVLLDMIGDKDLTLTLSQDTDPDMLKRLYRCAVALGKTEKLSAFHSVVFDDHVPFQQLGIPSIDLIDFEFGPDNAYWHTDADTMDKLAPESLDCVMQLAFGLIWDIALIP